MIRLLWEAHAFRGILQGQRNPLELAKLRNDKCKRTEAEIARAYRMAGVDLTVLEAIDPTTALVLLSEVGPDVSRFPTVKQFTSWLGLCPNWKKTGGKVKSSKTRQGKGRAARAFRLAAWSLLRSQSYLGAYLRRQRSRLGAPKAITATAHKLARIVYHLVRYGLA